MAICINCHTTDKGFFAPRCHACNEECSFLMQCAASLLFTTVYVGTTIGLMWLIFWILFG